MIAAQQQGGARQLGMPAPVAGMSQYPPQFNFGNQGPNYASMGASAGMAPLGMVGPGLGMAAVGAGMAQTAGGLTASAASHFGFATPQWASRFAGSRALGMMGNLDPTTAFLGGAWSGGSAAFAGGAGVGGIAGRAALGGVAGMANPVTMGAMAATFAASNIHQGHVQQQQINSQLGGFGFLNAQAHSGRGFGVQQMGAIGAQMRGMETKDAFVGMGDMQSILQKFNDFGMGQSVQDATEFGKRLKKMTETVTTMAKVLGTTIDDASAAFGKLRSSGFYTASDVMGASHAVRTSQSLGMTSDQAFGTMAAGAAMSRGFGMSGAAGAKAALSTTQSLQYASRYGGALSEDNLMDITGAGTGAEAQQAFGMRMQGAMTSFLTGTGAGRGILAGMGEVKDGKFTGGLNKGMSGASLDTLLDQGRKNMSGPDGGLSFVAKEKKIADALLKSGQSQEATLQIIKSIAGDKFGDRSQDDMVDVLISHMTGMSLKESEAAREMVYKYQETKRGLTQQARAASVQGLYALDVAQNRSVGGLMQKVKGGFSDSVSSHFQQLGARGGVALEAGLENISDRTFGLTRYGGTSAARDATSDARAMYGLTAASSGSATMSSSQKAQAASLASSLTSGGANSRLSTLSTKGGYSASDVLAIVGSAGSNKRSRKRVDPAVAAAALEQAGFVGMARTVRDEAEGGGGAALTLQESQDGLNDALISTGVRSSYDLVDFGTNPLTTPLLAQMDAGTWAWGKVLGEGNLLSRTGDKASRALRGLRGEEFRDVVQGGPMLEALAALKRKGKTGKDVQGWHDASALALRSGEDRNAAGAEALRRETGADLTPEQYAEFLKITQSEGGDSIIDRAASLEKLGHSTSDYSALVMSLSTTGMKDAGIDSRSALVSAAGSGNDLATMQAMDKYIREIGAKDFDIERIAGEGGDQASVMAATSYKRAMAARSDADLRALGVTEEVLALGGTFDEKKDIAGRFLGRKDLQSGQGGVFSDRSGAETTALIRQAELQRDTAKSLQAVTEMVQGMQRTSGTGKATADVQEH